MNVLQASTKKWAFLEKINSVLFFRFDNYCGPLEGGSGQIRVVSRVSNRFK